MRSELIRWVVGIGFAQVATIIAVLKLAPGASSVTSPTSGCHSGGAAKAKCARISARSISWTTKTSRLRLRGHRGPVPASRRAIRARTSRAAPPGPPPAGPPGRKSDDAFDPQQIVAARAGEPAQRTGEIEPADVAAEADGKGVDPVECGRRPAPSATLPAAARVPAANSTGPGSLRLGRHESARQRWSLRADRAPQSAPGRSGARSVLLITRRVGDRRLPRRLGEAGERCRRR